MGQPSHWTYRSFVETDDLQQGDIIRRSPALLKVLSDVLSYFCDERYTAFLVVTQSCDLVRRNGDPCNAEYINLCVIRELEPLLPKMLEACCGVGIPGVFASDSRWRAEQLLQRLLNQNEQARGLFYLHPDAGVGIATPSVALLRVSIALWREHYEMLQSQDCRCGRLAPEYAAKLGWLTGNLYSRVPTPDWEDQEKDKRASSKQTQSLLQRISKPEDENWVPAKWLKVAREKNVDLTDIPAERFRSTLAQHAPPELLDVVLDSVQRVGRGVVMDEPSNETSNRLAEHDEFLRQIAQHVGTSSGSLLSHDEQVALTGALNTDAKFRKAMGNQVANLLKQNAVRVGAPAMNDLANLLARSTGMLMPANNRLRALLSNLIGAGRVNEIGRIEELVAETCVFNQAACQMAGEVVQAVCAQVHFDTLDKLISRLRNDQVLGAACREHSADQAAV